jgi:hypothetical protein
MANNLIRNKLKSYMSERSLPSKPRFQGNGNGGGNGSGGGGVQKMATSFSGHQGYDYFQSKISNRFVHNEKNINR